MTDVIFNKINESYIKLECGEDILAELYSKFSEFTPGYIFNPRYKMHIWDGKIHEISPKTGAMPIGLLTDCISYLKEKGYTYSFDNMGSIIDETIDSYIKASLHENMKFAPYPIRDYQEQAVYQALKYKKGILLSCTSSGKSLMIFNILKTLITKKNVKKAMLIVPNITLVTQIFSDFKDYGWQNIEDEVTMLYGENKYNTNFRLPVLITTWQSIQKKEKVFFEDYDAVIVDEAHQSKSDVLSKILKSCINARYKIGTTGTLPTDKCEQLQIKAVLGNVLFELRSKDLIERGLLTKITIGNILLKYPIEFIKKHKNLTYPEEVRYVEEYPDRNKALDLIINHSKPEYNILLLVNHNEHLKNLKEWLNNNYPNRKVSIINGSVKAKEREVIRTGIENEDGTILLATFGTMSTGVNIPKLHEVILYSNSKSKIKVLQSIGRGLRKHNSKSHVILYDIIDDLSYTTPRGKLKKNYLLEHWEERKKYYVEQEFPMITTQIQI